MKRRILISTVIVLFSTVLFAYNPPCNGENFNELSSARALSGSTSVCGGGIFYVNPSSILSNPALTYDQQRIGINLGYSLLISSNPSDSKSIASALQAGIVIPTKWTVATFLVNGIFVPFESMNLNDSINLKVNFAKSITDKLSVGLNFYSGVFWGAETDWSLGLDFGFLYDVGDLGLFKEFRYAVSVLNNGKNYSKTSALGLHPNDSVSTFPSVCTIKAGLAGLFVSNDKVNFGFSFDLTTPCFQNFIFDAGLELSIKDTVFFNINEKFNLAENVAGFTNYIPSFGVSFRFSFGFKDNQYMEKNGWSESELSSTLAYKQLNTDIHIVSAEFDMNLGEEDTTPPVITLWIDEE